MNASVYAETARIDAAASPVGRFDRTFWLALALAVVYTLINALKPVHIDDTTYYDFAHQIAEHPTDPYGFSLMYFNAFQPANKVLAPPVVPYWWAPAIRLFDGRPFLWKLWFLPFSVIFALSLWALLRRFARGLEAPLLCLTLLSPVFLPSLNLMLDVPAEALSLLAVVVFMRAVDRDVPMLALLAGAIAGVAMQTKYTALLAPAAMLIYALLWRRSRLWLQAALAATLVFSLWEIFVAARYGESHFLLHVGERQRTLGGDVNLAVGLLTQLGGTTVVLGIFALLGLARRAWLIAAAGVAVIAVYVCLALGVFSAGAVIAPLPDTTPLTAGDVLFGSLGLFVLSTLIGAAAALLARSGPQRREALFLILWLAIEILGCFVVSPFPAARRLMGLAIPGTLIVGRLAAERLAVNPRRALVWGVTALGIALGALYDVVDVREAFAEKEAIAAAFEAIGPRPPGTTIWHTTSWACKFYAEQAGARQLAPRLGADKTPRPAHLRPGDWLLLVAPPIPRVELALYSRAARREGTVEVADRLPLSTIDFYAGRTPMQHQSGPRVSITLVRITDDTFVGSGLPR